MDPACRRDEKFFAPPACPQLVQGNGQGCACGSRVWALLHPFPHLLIGGLRPSRDSFECTKQALVLVVALPHRPCHPLWPIARVNV